VCSKKKNLNLMKQPSSIVDRVVDPDPHYFGLLDPDADPGGAKMTHKYRKSKEFSCFVEVLDVVF
jgi:hypothetical protein